MLRARCIHTIIRGSVCNESKKFLIGFWTKNIAGEVGIFDTGFARFFTIFLRRWCCPSAEPLESEIYGVVGWSRRRICLLLSHRKALFHKWCSSGVVEGFFGL